MPPSCLWLRMGLRHGNRGLARLLLEATYRSGRGVAIAARGIRTAHRVRSVWWLAHIGLANAPGTDFEHCYKTKPASGTRRLALMLVLVSIALTD